MIFFVWLFALHPITHIQTYIGDWKVTCRMLMLKWTYTGLPCYICYRELFKSERVQISQSLPKYLLLILFFKKHLQDFQDCFCFTPHKMFGCSYS